jgi:hypothetical protein
MPYILNVEQRNNYLYITVTGENSYDNVISYLSEVRDKCVQYKCPNVLIVENLAGPSLTTFSIYDIVSKVSKETTSVVRMVAYVDINPEHDATRMTFAENAAVNRGVFVQVFSTVQAAEQWIGRLVKPRGNG